MRRGVLAAVLLISLGCSARRGPELGPRSVERGLRPCLAQADALRRGGREDEAVAAYARIVEENPTSVPAHLRYIGTLLDTGRRSEARRIYRERAARPGASEPDRVMAQRLETDGSSTALRRVYTLASEVTPQVAWWRLALVEIDLAEAEAWNRRRLEAIDRGDRDEETGAWDQVLAALARSQRALDLAQTASPSLAEVDYYAGLLRAVEGDVHLGAVARNAAYHSAEDAFIRAVRRDPDLIEAWEGLGDVLLRTGDLKGSLLAFRKATELSPADPHFRLSLGVVLQRIERYDEAALQFLEAARLMPRDADPWMRLGEAYAGAERWEKALEAWREALRRDGEAVEAWYRQGTVFEHLGEPGEARAAYERYLAQGGEHAGTVRRRVDRLLRAEETGR